VHEQLIDIRYRSWKSERRRQVAPLGLVLKAGAWYLIGSVGTSVCTYRISRIRELVMRDEHFERPSAFELADHWREMMLVFESPRFQSCRSCERASRAFVYPKNPFSIALS
jgi:predicted DNA-binding transcriptional regulator YafY